MKIVVLNKWNAGVSILILVFAFVFVLLNMNNNESIATINTKKRDLPIYSVGRDDMVIAMSFDAAWGNEDTHLLIQILDKYKVKTTFFVVGQWVDKFPESVKELSDAGHEIMNHSNTHPHMTKLSSEKTKAEINAADEKIFKITGKKPNLFRPPFGDYNDNVVSTLRELGHYTIQWDVETFDIVLVV